MLLTVIGCLVFYFAGDFLIGLYLQENESAADIAATLQYGKEYLLIMLIGLVPYAITQAYAGTLRETGETILPMRAGLVAVFVNLVLNYLLIFGKFGFPKLKLVCSLKNNDILLAQEYFLGLLHSMNKVAFQ